MQTIVISPQLEALERAAITAGHKVQRIPDNVLGNWLRVYVGGEDLDGTISYFAGGSHFISVGHQFTDGAPEVAALKALAVVSAYRTIQSLAAPRPESDVDPVVASPGVVE